mmetsp:Transcript_37079/g.106049  ORF Transcript_37079/g.106049 Transcript_37079/m.106049 type:complete len:320 (+) Transcript_37079:118-1077(+)
MSISQSWSYLGAAALVLFVASPSSGTASVWFLLRPAGLWDSFRAARARSRSGRSRLSSRRTRGPRSARGSLALDAARDRVVLFCPSVVLALPLKLRFASFTWSGLRAAAKSDVTFVSSSAAAASLPRGRPLATASRSSLPVWFGIDVAFSRCTRSLAKAVRSCLSFWSGIDVPSPRCTRSLARAARCFLSFWCCLSFWLGIDVPSPRCTRSSHGLPSAASQPRRQRSLQGAHGAWVALLGSPVGLFAVSTTTSKSRRPAKTAKGGSPSSESRMTGDLSDPFTSCSSVALSVMDSLHCLRPAGVMCALASSSFELLRFQN